MSAITDLGNRIRAWAEPRQEAAKRSLPGRIHQRFAAAECPTMATVISYAAFFSMFPLILAILAILGFVLRDPSLLAQARSVVIEAFPPTAAAEVVDVLEGLVPAANTYGVISLVGLLWSSSALFGSVDSALSRIYGVEPMPFVPQKLRASGMIFLFAVLIVLFMLATTLAQVALQLARRLPGPTAQVVGPLAALVSWAISLGLAFALFAAVYRVFPNANQRFGNIWRGALAAAILFVILSQIFPLYVRYAGAFGTYGALFGLAFLLLTWLYLVGQVIVLGGALNAVVCPPERKGDRR